MDTIGNGRRTHLTLLTHLRPAESLETSGLECKGLLCLHRILLAGALPLQFHEPCSARVTSTPACEHASMRAREHALLQQRTYAEEESDKRLNRRETLEEAIDASSDVGEVLGLLVLRQVESRWQCSRPEDEVVGQERRRHGVHPYCPDQLACVAAHIHTTPARTPTGPVREATWLRRRLATSASFSSLSLHYAYRYILNLQPHLQPHLTSLSLTH